MNYRYRSTMRILCPACKRYEYVWVKGPQIREIDGRERHWYLYSMDCCELNVNFIVYKQYKNAL